MPGIASGAESTGAPGSAGSHGTGADSVPAGAITRPDGLSMPDARPDGGPTHGTVMPGQSGETPISYGPADQYTDTGAGSGSGTHYPRRPGQQPNGGA
jgi:hypothetical protein